MLKLLIAVFLLLGLLTTIAYCKGEEKMTYPEKFTMPLKPMKEYASPMHRCPATVQFSNEIACFMDVSNQSYGYVNLNDSDWRCDINYTLVNMLSTNSLMISNTTMEDDAVRKYVVELFGFEYNSYDPDKLGKEITKEVIKRSLFENKEFVLARFLPNVFFGGVVVGYEDNGDTLLVFTYEAFNFEPNLEPKIVKASFNEWFNGSQKVLYTIGKRKSTPELPALYKEGLKAAKNYLFDEKGNMRNEADYKEWINILAMSDEDALNEMKKTKKVFGRLEPLTDEELTKENLLDILRPIADPQWCDYAERRYYAAHFMRQAKTHYPNTENELEEVAKTFDEVNPLAYEYIEKTGHDPVDLEKLGNPETRKEMSQIADKFYNIEKRSMETLKDVLSHFAFGENYLLDKDVRIVYLPPCTVAASHYIGDKPELHAGEALDKFIKDNKLWEKKPDMRHFGFNHPNPSDDKEFYGYEMWVTIPDDMEVPAPLVKRKFEGGLYAAHMIPMGRFEEWGWLYNWSNQSSEYEVDMKESWDENDIMWGFLEEALNYVNYVKEGKDKPQLDLLLPIKKRVK